MKLYLKFQNRRIEINVAGESPNVSDLYARASELGFNISRYVD